MITGDRPSTQARLAALAIFALAMVSLRAQFDVTRAATGLGVAQSVWLMAGYFTVLTNALVALLFMVIATGRPVGANALSAATASILMVGIVYHLVLADLWAPQGAAWWADQGLHTGVPLAVLGWWLAFAPSQNPGLRQVGLWLAWPVAYLAYAVLRGAVAGFWAYPFLDPAARGVSGVSVNVIVMMVAFAALCAALAMVARARFSR